MTEQKVTEAEVLEEQETADGMAAPECEDDTAQHPESAETSAEAEQEAAEPAEDAREAETEASEESPEAEDAGDGEADAAPESEPDTEGTDKKGKKGFFKKKEKKDPKEEKIAELTDRLQRQMAEFDNFRKRTEKEKASMYQIGAKDVIEKLLPVVDNFERGLETGDESDPFVDGMNKIYKQLTTMLTDLGVTPIEAVGQPFDPDLHNAVMHIDDESLGENVVAEEFQKGYKYKDSVVRFSMVKVAN